MKEFVFLYPVQEYFESCIGREFIKRDEVRGVFNKFNEIIDVRYRLRGFRINWVMFSDKANYQLPDLSIKAKEIAIAPDDRILVSGISFLTHTSAGIYPEPSYILRQLPAGLDRLVVGGFHQGDCVDKLAKVAYEQGIPTIIDEDTTDIFFRSIRYSLTVPLIRDGIPLEEEVSPTMLYLFKDRPLKPWFT